jgi:hypothetical protein
VLYLTSSIISSIFIVYINFAYMAAGRGLDIPDKGEAGRRTRRFVRVTNKEEGGNNKVYWKA